MGAAYLGVTVFIVVMVAVLIPAIGEFARAIGEQGSDSVASLNEWTEDVFGITVFDSGVAQSGAEGAEEFIGGWASEVFGAITGIAPARIGLVFSAATIAMFTFYFTADSPRLTACSCHGSRPRPRNEWDGRSIRPLSRQAAASTPEPS